MSKKRENKSLILKLISLKRFKMDLFKIEDLSYRTTNVYLAGGQTPYIFPLVRGADSIGPALRSQSDPDHEVEEQG